MITKAQETNAGGGFDYNQLSLHLIEEGNVQINAKLPNLKISLLLY